MARNGLPRVPGVWVSSSSVRRTSGWAGFDRTTVSYAGSEASGVRRNVSRGSSPAQTFTSVVSRSKPGAWTARRRRPHGISTSKPPSALVPPTSVTSAVSEAPTTGARVPLARTRPATCPTRGGAGGVATGVASPGGPGVVSPAASVLPPSGAPASPASATPASMTPASTTSNVAASSAPATITGSSSPRCRRKATRTAPGTGRRRGPRARPDPRPAARRQRSAQTPRRAPSRAPSRASIAVRSPRHSLRCKFASSRVSPTATTNPASPSARELPVVGSTT